MDDNNKKIDSKKLEKEGEDNPVSQPDPETLHKTDPQENMKGPISSLLNKAKDNLEENGGKTVEERKEEKKEEKKNEEE